MTIKFFYAFVPTYGYGSTAFHRHIISAGVFFYSNTLQIVFVDYAVTDMDCFDDYSNAAPREKQLGEIVLLHLFCTLTNLSLSIKQLFLLEYEGFSINGHIALGLIYIQKKELMSLMTINLLICLELFV